MTSFCDLLDQYRAESLSEAEKGTKFEQLMRAYLLALPKYQGLISKVWLWHDFPCRTDFGSGHDLGIDLVALTVTGEYWAVQCKCYTADTYITKESVDTFLSTSGKRFSDGNLEPQRFSRRLWISTTDNWSANAETSLLNQVPPVMKIGLADLAQSPVDWGVLEAKAHGHAGREPLPIREPLEHQNDAVAAAHDHFKTYHRGKLIMACGTGKTYTSLKIAENEVKPTGLVLFLVPSIALLGQTLDEWTAHAEKPIRPMCVCSDADVSRKQKATDDGGFTVEDLAFPAVTNTDEIIRQFRQLDLLAKTNKGFRVVFSTYQSLPQVIKAQKALNRESAHQADFDLVICDEAHRTTGAAAKDVKESAFILVHDDSNLVAANRLYMTATPRVYNDKVKDDAKTEDVILCSMDDEAIYGKEFYRIDATESSNNATNGTHLGKGSSMNQSDFMKELCPVKPFKRDKGDKRKVVVSMFSGAGGLDMGFFKEDYNIVWANDFDEDACATYKANIGNHIRCGDIEGWMYELEQFKDTIDVLIGGPPCQGFSVAGKMDPDDPRSQNVWRYLKALGIVRPRAFLMENVKALGALDKWRDVREKLLAGMRELGYNANYIVVNAADYNVPQNRERVLFIGFLEKSNEPIDLEAMLKPYKIKGPTVKEVLAVLDRPGTGNNAHVCNAKVTFCQKPVMRKSPYAGMLFNGLGRPIRINGYCATLPASMGGNKTPIIDEEELYNGKKSFVEEYHKGLADGSIVPEFKEAPKRLRRLTVEEAAAIQAFPLGYKFVGSRTTMYKQIGNAVPCNLSRQVAKMMKKKLEAMK